MKPFEGLCLIFLAGCTGVPLQENTTVSGEETPTSRHASRTETLAGTTQDELTRSTRDETPLTMPPATSVLIRVGLESLPPQGRLAGTHTLLRDNPAQGSVPSQPGVVVSPSLSRLRTLRPDTSDDYLEPRWELRREQIRAKTDSVERMTLRFLSELVGDDRKRVQRAIGAPLLRSQMRRPSDPMYNYMDERDREDQQRLLTSNGTRMIRRPLRNALKELPIFSDVEVAIREIRQQNVRYTRKKADGLGRLTVRLRANLENPLELAWLRSGIKIASSSRHVKAEYSTRWTDRLAIGLRTRFRYFDDSFGWFADLAYQLNDYTTFHAIAGDNINILAGPASYPGGPQGGEASGGAMLFFNHQF